MANTPTPKSKRTTSCTNLPIVVEKDEDGFYVIECPILPGCYTQGDTLDEALENIQEVIELLAEEKDIAETIRNYTPQEISFHTISISL